jgi:hypothetical protein
MFNCLQAGICSPPQSKISGIYYGATVMGKKIIFFFLLLCLCAVPSATELGRITELYGEVSISRNLEIMRPVVASRIYAKDLILLGDDAFVRIESTRNIWQIQGPALVTAEESGRFIEEYGTLSWRRKRSGRKNLSQAIGYTLVFPGWGHWYIEDYFKAVPMFAGTTWVLWNIFSNNPQHSNQPELTSQTRQNFQQLYLVYLIVAIMDVWSETNRYNKQLRAISLEEN